MSQGDSFIKVKLSVDDPKYPNSQGIKRAEVRCIVYNVL